MQRTVCDRCGADIPPVVLDAPRSRRIVVIEPLAENVWLDVCAICSVSFYGWLAAGSTRTTGTMTTK